MSYVQKLHPRVEIMSLCFACNRIDKCPQKHPSVMECSGFVDREEYETFKRKIYA